MLTQHRSNTSESFCERGVLSRAQVEISNPEGSSIGRAKNYVGPLIRIDTVVGSASASYMACTKHPAELEPQWMHVKGLFVWRYDADKGSKGLNTKAKLSRLVMRSLRAAVLSCWS